jgi:hypothetical protein
MLNLQVMRLAIGRGVRNLQVMRLADVREGRSLRDFWRTLRVFV